MRLSRFQKAIELADQGNTWNINVVEPESG